MLEKAYIYSNLFKQKKSYILQFTDLVKYHKWTKFFFKSTLGILTFT